MSAATIRGGVPRVLAHTVDNGDPTEIAFPFFTNYLQVYTTGEAVKVYFTEEDAADGANFLTVPIAAATHPWGWEGPAELGRVWLQSASGTDAVVTMVAYQRLG